MKILIGAVSVVAALVSGSAFAWSSTFFDELNGNLFTRYESVTPEAAQRGALERCREMAKGARSRCVEIGSPVHGGAVVLAAGDLRGERFVKRITGLDADEAAQAALDGCRKEAANCVLEFATWDEGLPWMAVAWSLEEGEVMALRVASNKETEGEAKALAISSCEEQSGRKGSCEIVWPAVSGQAWFAVAANKNDIGLGVSHISAEAARKQSLESCAETSEGAPCSVVDEIENAAPLPVPKSFVELEARIKREEAQRKAARSARVSAPAPVPVATDTSCRPRSETVRCTSQCSNGDCVVTYENGCKIRVQVAPKFNPFNNQLEFLAPNC